MKIAHVVYDLSMGGMERMVVDLAKRQAENGDTVAVYCISGRGILADELTSAGVPVIALEKHPGMDLRILFRLVRTFRSECTDVVHTHNNVASLYGGVAGRFSGVKRVLNTRHGMADMPYDHRREMIYRFSVTFCHRVVFVCHKALEFSVRKRIVPRRKGVVIFNGIDLSPFGDQNAGTPRALREECGFPPDAAIVGTVCRLTAAKDLPTFVNLAELVCAVRRDVRFVIVGAGEEEMALRGLIHEKGLVDCVILTGLRTDVSKLLPAFDLFVQTSVSEGMSLALIEAAAAGVAIVTTDAGGSADVVVDGETGYVVKVGDIDALVDRTLRLLADGENASQMGKAGRERAFREFGMETMSAGYDRLYASIGAR